MLFALGLAVTTGSIASDYSEEFYRTVSLNWRHYDPWGHITLTTRADSEFNAIRSAGIGHYFDAVDGGFHVTWNRGRTDDTDRWGISLTKNLKGWQERVQEEIETIETVVLRRE